MSWGERGGGGGGVSLFVHMDGAPTEPAATFGFESQQTEQKSLAKFCKILSGILAFSLPDLHTVASEEFTYTKDKKKIATPKPT